MVTTVVSFPKSLVASFASFAAVARDADRKERERRDEGRAELAQPAPDVSAISSSRASAARNGFRSTVIAPSVWSGVPSRTSS